jgi:phosphoribosyl 1,2-cyclic phosphodiesterase
MDFFVKFWGTRGSIPTPGHRTQKFGGNTSCVEMRIADELFICDGGSGIRELGLDLMARGSKNIIGHMFFSHTHWDHIQGFPFFVPAYLPQNTFHVYTAPGGGKHTFELLSGQMNSDYFPVSFSDLGACIIPKRLQGRETIISNIAVASCEMNHPGGAVGYSFKSAGHKVVYALDNEIDPLLENPAESLADASIPRKIPQSLVDFASGADLLIADGQYTDEEYLSKAGSGHSRATTLVDLAICAGVKQLAVMHHDPLQDDEAVSNKIEACRKRAESLGSEIIVFGAREGMELKIE